MQTQQILNRIAQCILDFSKYRTIKEAAKLLGLKEYDIKNLRAGNLPGLPLFLRLVKKGRYSPHALIASGNLRKLDKTSQTRGAQQRRITVRIRELAKKDSAKVLAARTGLSEQSVYQLRDVGNKPPGLKTIIAFINAGASAEMVFFG